MSDQAALNQVIKNVPYLEKAMKARVPGVKVLKTEKTTISDQQALMTLVSTPRSTLGETIEINTFMVQTFRNGSAYSVACRASKEKFEQFFPTFIHIIGSFSFWR